VAAHSNDEEMTEYLLELGAHPDVMDLKGRTAAMRAVEFGHVQVLEKLLAAGASMKLTDLDGKGNAVISVVRRSPRGPEISGQIGLFLQIGL
jgi:ankyrin repeat protein